MSLVLLSRIQAGDEHAAHQLSEAHGPAIRRLALRHLGNPEDAEEVVQDVLWTVIRKSGSFRGEAKLSTWIHRVAFNATMTRLRRSLRRRDVDDDLAQDASTRTRHVPDDSPSADAHLYRAQLRQRLVRALRGLPPPYRAAVVLRDVQGLSTTEAGAVLAVSGATLKSRLHRGRVLLRRALSDLAPVGGSTAACPVRTPGLLRRGRRPTG